ncbi:pentatricopeptide repeat-containing protein at1g74600 chloroplastic [Phtheirospermum japonicum]|uniref:Pentatricopeptide repeat-containing protein at1g74600 chloroplastic n=1 Tax=Phtheirospermum japonicum TaxID=374723 RepID=A0A830CT97_9LAMI|nr:pentatricopeptide repeat-containing protein at1g74600 chloroplastic [Phtheirospermum japonicum]
MNGTILLTTFKHQKLLCICRKFMSSAALIGGTPTEYAKTRSNHDPFHLLSNPTNLKGLTLSETKAAHALFLKTHVIYSNIYAANNLIDGYSECNHMGYAFKVFDGIPLRNLVTWNLMILGCNKNSLFDDSWRFFCLMHNVGVDMDEFTYGTMLSACGALLDVTRGVKIYGLVMKNGFFSNGYIRAGMIDLFSKCCRVDDALRVLYDDIHCENVVCWNTVVSGAVKNKDNFLALEVFDQMCRHGFLSPNSFTFSSVLTACASVKELELGKSIHGRVIKVGARADVFVGTAIVDLYAKSGAMSDAVKQFKQMPIQNVVSWTAIISGFVQKGDSASAVRILNDMHKTGEEINNFTVSSVLSACANPDMFGEALQIHCWILKIGLYLNPVVKASLINTYAKAGAVNLSEIAFAESENLMHVGIWANMISAFVQSDFHEKAIVLFRRMINESIKPNKFSVSSILSVIDSLTFGRQVHGYTLKVDLVSEVSVGSSILTMYSKCGNFEDSLKAFENLDTIDNVSWTSMIAGFAEHGYPDKSIKLFREMGFEKSILDEKIIASVLNACSYLHSLKLGREIHGFALRHGFDEQSIVNEALVNLYSKCGDLNSARIVFNKMPFKSQVTRSSLISGFAKKGHADEALRLFHEMLSYDIIVDAFTISSVLGALEVSSEMSTGFHLHAYIVKTGFESEASVGSSLIMMYSKCGHINDCNKVFKYIIDPDLVSWTTMIASYAHNGKGLEALQLFDLMKKSGIEPDDVTFVGVLSACSHAGLVEEGYFHLNSMTRDYKIEPGQKHYACVVDILGRAGRLEEAERFIVNMPIEADILVWETLLAACKVHGDCEVGKVAAEKIMELEPSEAGAYISVSNIWAEAGEWDRVVGIRSSMREIGLRKKEPGWSYV